MFKRLSLIAIVVALCSTSAFAEDFGTDLYDTYDGGFYNDTTSDLYDVNDDWYYDNYTIGEQREEDVGFDTYDWEADDDLFDDTDLDSDTL